MGSAQSEPAQVIREARAARRRREREFMEWKTAAMESKPLPILNTQPVPSPSGGAIPDSARGIWSIGGPPRRE